jgi:hypothetical protein
MIERIFFGIFMVIWIVSIIVVAIASREPKIVGTLGIRDESALKDTPR